VTPRRYIVDDTRLEPERALALHRTVLRWAALRAESFVLYVDPTVYERPGDVDALLALGDGEPDRSQTRSVAVRGQPGPEVVERLVSTTAPPGASAGDLSPVEDVSFLAGDRRLFGSYDYGRDQLLELTEDELALLEQTLREAGFDAVIVPAPPFATGSSEN
jgi:hypothetical protein